MHIMKYFSLTALFGAGALASGGCADNRTSLYIDGVQGFEVDGECDLDPSVDSDRIGVGQGTYDPGSGLPYYAPLIIGNQLVPQGNNDTLRPETSRIQLEGAIVQVIGLDVGNTGLVSETTSYFSGTVDPVDSTSPGVAAVTVALFKNEDLRNGTYQVKIRVFGTTLGGTEVESGDFLFPVLVEAGSSPPCVDPELAHPCGWPQDGFCRL